VKQTGTKPATVEADSCQSAKIVAPKIPDHEMIRRIGAGSYGEVWLAKNVVGTYRAVKVVYRAKFRDARPFEREFTGIKNFEPISRTHPGLVSILHIGRNDSAGYFYYVMEIADDLGGAAIQPDKYAPRTLSAEIESRGRFQLCDSVQIGLALASALEHLHGRGLVHRDIKPSNIIFIQNEPKLADIGLVVGIKEAGSVVGTIGYISPEGPGAPEADIYSLGKVLYEISTGKDRESFPELPTEPLEAGSHSIFRKFNDLILKACENDPRHRYKLAGEMREALRSCQTGASDAFSPPTSRPLHSRTTPIKGERKLLTVLFLEISAVEGTDPEEAQSLMESSAEIVRPLIERFEGSIGQSQNDRLVAFFGAPVACEDHTHRAAQAALACREALAAYSDQLRGTGKSAFEFRAALNTGLAVIARPTRHSAFNATGETITLAPRLLTLALPGQILGLEETCRSIQDFFEIHPLEEHRLPGKTAPVKIYEIRRARERRSRLDARARHGLTPLVGRAKELAVLRERFAEAKGGHGQIVLIAGEAGVGKSRLLREFRQDLGASEVAWLAGHSISFGGQMAYLPINELLRGLFRLEDADSEATILSKLEAGVTRSGEEVRFGLPYIKHLFAVDSHNDAVARMDPQERRLQTLDAIRKLLLKTAQHAPLVVVIEDLHWIDKASEEFLLSFADSLAMARVLVLLSYRPGYRNPFPDRSYLTRVALRQLTEDETIQLAGGVLAGAPLPAELRQLIVAKADGNPFFIEELLKSLLESGALQRQNDQYSIATTLRQIHLPETIQDVIMTRIGRLEESSRRALQLASVIGREFAVNLLETISNLPVPLGDCLQKLKALELIYERSLFPEHICRFKHALTQEVAYNSLLIQSRKELHSLVAAAIEEIYAKRLPEFYGLLAYHYEQGEEWEPALEYLQRAAEHSRSVAAHREESSLLSRAIIIAGRLDRPALVVELRGKRGSAWAKVGMWPEAKPELENVLAQLPPELWERRAELLLDLAAVNYWALDIPAMRKNATEGYQLVEKSNRRDLIAASMGWIAGAEAADGKSDAALDLFERAATIGAGSSCPPLSLFPMVLYWRGRINDAVRRGFESARALQDTWASTFGTPHLGLALAATGRYAEAQRVFSDACRIGLKCENWKFHARALCMSAGFYLDVFDFESHERIMQEALERARAVGFKPTIVMASLDLVFNHTRRNQVTDEKILAETAEIIKQMGGWHRWLMEVRLSHARAEVALTYGNPDEAILKATESISQCRTGQRMKYEIAGLETRARALALKGRTNEAISDLQRAIELARSMGDPAMLLRTLTALLPIDGSDTLLAEARATAQSILVALPNAEMQARFCSAQTVQQLALTFS
jgi:serine/threonine protein kinase/tetratricopeptide (TPR) repeat protein